MENLVHGAFALAAAVAAVIPVMMVRSTGARDRLAALDRRVGDTCSHDDNRSLHFRPSDPETRGASLGSDRLRRPAVPVAAAARRAVRAIPLESLVRWQTARVIGGFFIIGAAMGEVPMLFAVIAGTGDILVGIVAARAAKAMKAGDPLRPAFLHTALGLADFAVAIGTAI